MSNLYQEQIVKLPELLKKQHGIRNDFTFDEFHYECRTTLQFGNEMQESISTIIFPDAMFQEYLFTGRDLIAIGGHQLFKDKTLWFNFETKCLYIQ